MKCALCNRWCVGCVIFGLHGKSLGWVPSSEPVVGVLPRRSGWRLTSGANEGTGGFAGGFATQVETHSYGMPGFAGGVEEAARGVEVSEIQCENLRGIILSRVWWV